MIYLWHFDLACFNLPSSSWDFDSWQTIFTPKRILGASAVYGILQFGHTYLCTFRVKISARQNQRQCEWIKNLRIFSFIKLNTSNFHGHDFTGAWEPDFSWCLSWWWTAYYSQVWDHAFQASSYLHCNTCWWLVSNKQLNIWYLCYCPFIFGRVKLYVYMCQSLMCKMRYLFFVSDF